MLLNSFTNVLSLTVSILWIGQRQVSHYIFSARSPAEFVCCTENTGLFPDLLFMTSLEIMIAIYNVEAEKKWEIVLISIKK